MKRVWLSVLICLTLVLTALIPVEAEAGLPGVQLRLANAVAAVDGEEYPLPLDACLRVSFDGEAFAAAFRLDTAEGTLFPLYARLCGEEVELTMDGMRESARMETDALPEIWPEALAYFRPAGGSAEANAQPADASALIEELSAQLAFAPGERVSVEIAGRALTVEESACEVSVGEVVNALARADDPAMREMKSQWKAQWRASGLTAAELAGLLAQAADGEVALWRYRSEAEGLDALKAQAEMSAYGEPLALTALIYRLGEREILELKLDAGGLGMEMTFDLVEDAAGTRSACGIAIGRRAGMEPSSPGGASALDGFARPDREFSLYGLRFAIDTFTGAADARGASRVETRTEVFLDSLTGEDLRFAFSLAGEEDALGALTGELETAFGWKVVAREGTRYFYRGEDREIALRADVSMTPCEAVALPERQAVGDIEIGGRAYNLARNRVAQRLRLDADACAGMDGVAQVLAACADFESARRTGDADAASGSGEPAGRDEITEIERQTGLALPLSDRMCGWTFEHGSAIENGASLWYVRGDKRMAVHVQDAAGQTYYCPQDASGAWSAVGRLISATGSDAEGYRTLTVYNGEVAVGLMFSEPVDRAEAEAFFEILLSER